MVGRETKCSGERENQEGAGPIQSQIWNLVLELMRTQEEFANRCVVVDCDLDDVCTISTYHSVFHLWRDLSSQSDTNTCLLLDRYFGFLDVLRSENPYP